MAPPATDLAGAASEAAARFDVWLASKRADGSGMEGADGALNDLLAAAKPGDGLHEVLGNDLAAWLGETVRRAQGGAWQDHPFYGSVIAAPGDIPIGRVIPAAIVERKFAAGAKYSLPTFFATLESRFAAERKRAAAPVAAAPSVDDLTARLRGLSAAEASAAAIEKANLWRSWWKARTRADLPVTLLGVREVDGFLRSHYVVNFLDEVDLIQAGFFLGEVCRGLFQGDWDLRDLPSMDRAALHYPELDYYPVGRILKMMSERPEGSQLDEYVRLIPSARKELRRSK